MNSPVDICNQALSHIGDRRIERLDDEAQQFDPIARYCAEFYPQARTETLAAHRWSFAKKDAVLSRVTDQPAIGKFSYTHRKPSDCLRVHHLIPGGALDDEGNPTEYTGKVDKFELVGRDIKSNYQHVAVRYTCDEEDPGVWSPHCRAAVARKLAHYLAGVIGDDPVGMGNQQLKLYEEVDLPNAQFYDSVQDESGENLQIETRRAESPLLQERYQIGYGANGPDDA